MRRPLSRRSWLLIGALVVLLAPLFVGVPIHLRQDALIGPLGARYHVALFAVLTILLHAYGPLARRLPAVVAVCLALGGVSEWLQSFVGRSAMFMDWYQDALGIGLGTCWIMARRAPRIALPAAIVLLGLVAWPLRGLPTAVREAHAAAARFPLLDDFERPDAIALWSGHMGGEPTWVAAPGHGHVLQMDRKGDSPWPGVVSRKFPYDWRGYAVLRIDCRLQAPSPDSLRVAAWIADRRSAHESDFATRGMVVGHTWRTLTVPLADLVTHHDARPLDLAEITTVSIFCVAGDRRDVTLQIDNLRLTDH